MKNVNKKLNLNEYNTRIFYFILLHVSTDILDTMH